jgi:hypothetical protein
LKKEVLKVGKVEAAFVDSFIVKSENENLEIKYQRKKALRGKKCEFE